MTTEEQQTSTADVPEGEFLAGEYFYQVSAEPARMKGWMMFALVVPALAVAVAVGWLSSSFGAGIGAFVAAWAGCYWLLERALTKVDPRWKVTTSRRHDDEDSFLEPLNVEILNTEEQAKRRRSEVVLALLENAPEQAAKLNEKADRPARFSTRERLLMTSPLLISLGGMALALSAPDQPDGSIPPRAELGMVFVAAGLVLFFITFGVIKIRRERNEGHPPGEATSGFENNDPRLAVRTSEDVVSAPTPVPPIPERPKDRDKRFRDGDEWASVSVNDVWSPTRLSVGGKPKTDKRKDDGGNFLATALAPLMLVGALLMFLGLVVLVLLAVIFVSPVYLVLKRIDGRHKVTVHRTDSSGRFGHWRVLKVEFYKSEEEAKARQEEILKNWSTDYWSSTPTLSRADRRRLRMESR